MKEIERPIIDAFNIFAEWYNKNLNSKIGPLNKQEGIFHHKFNNEWEVVANGHDEELIEPVWKQPLEPYHMRVFRNGWLYLCLNPFEGEGIAGAEAAWLTFMKAQMRR